MRQLRLGAKFSAFLIVLFVLGSSLTVFILSNQFNYQAELAVKERADILISTMQAVRNYTQNNIQPLLDTDSLDTNNQDSFKSESVPTFSAKSVFADFRQQAPEFEDFFYKEAAPNPTNLADKADLFETQLVAQLRGMEMPEGQSLSGYRTLDGNQLFYMARPLILHDESCLACHGDPLRAPQSVVDMYGLKNGFGWQLNDIVATQIIYVPADTIFERGQENLWMASKILLSIFSAIFVVINLLLWRTVTQPLAVLTRVAKNISSLSTRPSYGESLDANGLTMLTPRQDELGHLSRAFDYMVYVLSERAQSLQQAVAERTRSLEIEMRDRQDAQDALQTYTHAIKHDLRNIVMGISMLVQGISLKASSTDVKNAVAVEPNALLMIQKSCDRQLNLMNSLGEIQSPDIWRIALRLETVNLRSVLEDIQIAVEVRLSNASATLDNKIHHHLPPLQADRSQLKRVFENLIDNALKYNPVGVEIVVVASVIELENKGSEIRCTVLDNGVGVSAEDQQDLFKIYARGQRDRKILGDGLGLYICRKIIDAHGGNIGLQNSPNGGAAFWFTLPIQA